MQYGETSGENWLQDNAPNILNSVVDAILTINDQGEIQFVNEATERLFEYSADELIGQPVSLLMPEPYKSQHQRFVDNFLNTGAAQIIGIGRELTGMTRSGKYIPIYLAVNELKSSNGSYFAGIVRDLTQQKEEQEAILEQRERLAQVGRLSTMGEMTASIAHEINQPLTAIAAYSQACLGLLEKDSFDLSVVVEGLRKLNEQSLRAGAVIEHIQRFVRQESSQKTSVDLHESMIELVNFASPDARLRDVEIAIEAEAGLPLVYCDPVQIEQVVLNLIRNAVDAMWAANCAYGTVVYVRLAHCEDGVEVSVVDSGVGIADEQARLMFSPFYSTKDEGLGMGLSICQSIVRQHGSDLRYTNNTAADTAQHGCTFYFQLPSGGASE